MREHWDQFTRDTGATPERIQWVDGERIVHEVVIGQGARIAFAA